eukprot:jgi/Psemu1/17567/gm1.17567_g
MMCTRRRFCGVGQMDERRNYVGALKEKRAILSKRYARSSQSSKPLIPYGKSKHEGDTKRSSKSSECDVCCGPSWKDILGGWNEPFHSGNKMISPCKFVTRGWLSGRRYTQSEEAHTQRAWSQLGTILGTECDCLEFQAHILANRDDSYLPEGHRARSEIICWLRVHLRQPWSRFSGMVQYASVPDIGIKQRDDKTIRLYTNASYQPDLPDIEIAIH